MRSPLLSITLPLLTLLAACAGKTSPRSGVQDVTVMLTGDPAHAEADAAVLNQRIERFGYRGEARPRGDGIEIAFKMPGDLQPTRLLRRILTPGQLAIRTEVAENDNAVEVEDCSAGPDTCHAVFAGPPHLTSDHVSEAEAIYDPALGTLVVVVRFSPEGEEILRRTTTDATGHRLVIEVDGQVLSRPLIHQPIEDGAAVIHFGKGTRERSLGAIQDLAHQISGPPLQSTWEVASAE